MLEETFGLNPHPAQGQICGRSVDPVRLCLEKEQRHIKRDFLLRKRVQQISENNYEWT